MELNIKHIAKEKGITGVELAKRIGISQQNMSGIMNNKFNPSLKTLEKISQALDVSITDLFADDKTNTFTCPNCGVELEIRKSGK